MKILVTGSSGLLGTVLVRALGRVGHMVCRLMRPESAANDEVKDGFNVAWNPATGELGGAGVGPDAVVNLAGGSIAGGGWAAGGEGGGGGGRVDTAGGVGGGAGEKE